METASKHSGGRMEFLVIAEAETEIASTDKSMGGRDGHQGLLPICKVRDG